MDFAENFSCSYDEEIQAAYFNKNYVALHPREVHYRNKYQDEDDETDLGCKLYIAIADDRSHNASTVFAVRQHFIPILKQDLLNIRYIHYLTDSKKSEYRNIFITTTLLKHESIFRSELTGYSSKPGTARVHLTVWAGSQKGMLRRPSNGSNSRSSTMQNIVSSGPREIPLVRITISLYMGKPFSVERAKWMAPAPGAKHRKCAQYHGDRTLPLCKGYIVLK